MLEGNRVSRISVRGFAVASATAVTAVGSVVGVASGSTAQTTDDAEAVANDTTLLADIPVGQQAEVQTASLTAQADAQSIAADASARKDAEETARKKAAQDAIDKQKAAEKAEELRKAKEEAEKKASAAGSLGDVPIQGSYSIAEIQAMAKSVVASDQWTCFSNIVDHESDWNYKAVNPSSGAYGLFQALPGSKMSSAGADWQTNPATQIKWGLNYMESRYGSPCGAWSFWQAHNWY
ncbi:transglycosylase SLT domain-containing protein [Streptomyces ipomoeae]|uniref:aggregation-promoting factor C-terminal-like domain-containing protein n=1 Tax=Streptomyces ipomoeae TaxID=103232 RepID=UPI0002DCC53B|nr:transglycosylase SLT domain-containing protein [Streptomyces ipomoeae]MDX2699197.1 transglycosylase SLT domain-containing protein [Streptomyces ipomoeae]MDX2827017.1 transglycosylase SLT domain-containing protein [Streptomyces ipomoeae]MDX2842397.1 transglycosylase SLT domain-containing protein [Streptomyces ipomoeae]MDX2878225.1 transglycosylase SLT domain-containing protein [Streptomyces ipomoeae]MDX2934024.1 transglycosylase SLT domain-containing protein [Streptomyces ipomoeae]